MGALAGSFACMIALVAGSTASEAVPTRPLRIIVPYAPDGPTDIVARLVGERLWEQVGQPVVIGNRPGGSIGTGLVAKATPDGHPACFFAVADRPALGRKLPYDPQSDVAPVSLVVTIPYLLLAHASGPSSVKELISLARANPGKLNYGSAGPATTSYFAAALFASLAKIELVHVPYKGSSQAAAELAGGHLTMDAIRGWSGGAPHPEDGKGANSRRLHARAVSADVRSADHPRERRSRSRGEHLV
ncbi:MAG: hypothetical protein GEV05_15400 [Betaproteobacteria bacterium]|nr:hypothetical protein [Betaproteobacteria bacterium]